LPLSSRNPS